jgi:hypothetical protein
MCLTQTAVLDFDGYFFLGKMTMRFFQKNARFIVPLPFLFLAFIKFSEAVENGNNVQLLGATGFLGVALLFYWVQKRIYLQRQKSLKDGIGNT